MSSNQVAVVEGITTSSTQMEPHDNGLRCQASEGSHTGQTKDYLYPSFSGFKGLLQSTEILIYPEHGLVGRA